MPSGLLKTIALCCAIATLIPCPASGGDPFLQRAVRDMEQQDAPPPAAEDGQVEDAESQSPRSAREQTSGETSGGREAERQAAIRAKLQAQRDARALAKAERAMDDLGPTLARAERLLDAGRYREAAAVLRKAAKDVAPLHHPRVQAMLGQLALLDGKPAKALEFVEPVLPAPNDIGVIDPRSLDAEALRPLERALLVAGQAHNELAVAHALADLEQKRAEQRRAGKARDSRKSNDFFGVAVPEEADAEPRSVEELVDHLAPPLYLPDLDYLGVPIDARSEKPDLSTRSAEHADQALRLFDHLAGTTTGEEQFEAAWRCGRSLALLGRYDDALDAFAFAHHTLRGMHPSDTPPHLKPLADGLSEDRKRVAYLRDVTRYGLEYLLYRRAQEHRLAGRYEKAAAGYRQVIDTAQDTMTRLLIEKLSTAPGFTTPADDNATKVDESPYTAASRLYEALCLIELGKAREAVQRLEAFADEDPATKLPTDVQNAAELDDAQLPGAPLLFRGQALLELGRIALEHELDLDRAEGYFARLDHWIVKARADNEAWAFNDLLPGIRKAAKARTDGPDREYRKPDFWGNVKKAPIDPGMLVNRKTTPWYLDDLEEDTAKFRGFLHFAKGDGENAMRQFERILKYDTKANHAEKYNSPNAYRRLKFGADHGFLIAHPEELANFNGKLRINVLLGDFYYVNSSFEDAKDVYFGMLTNSTIILSENQKDYLNHAVGMTVCWTQGDIAALPFFEKVLHGKDESYTKYRSGLAAAMIQMQSTDAEVRAAGEKLLHNLSNCGAKNPFVYRAMLAKAQSLAAAEDVAGALATLNAVPQEAGPYRTMAEWLDKEIRKHHQE